MNANRNLVIDFRINGKHDHYIQKNANPQPWNTKEAKKERRGKNGR